MPRRLVITEGQMEALRQPQYERFVDRMVVHLKRRYPAETATRDETALRGLIETGIRTAKGYGVVTERGVARYLELMVALSPEFDDSPETPWAKHILTARKSSEEQKLDRIYERVMFAGGGAGADGEDFGRVPGPIDDQAARAAYEEVWQQNPQLDRRRLTMAPRDNRYRRQWVKEYRSSLAGRDAVLPGSCPAMEVGSAVAPEPTPTGGVVVTVVDGESGRPVPRAEVHLAGSMCRSASSGASGVVRFHSVRTGQYRILAMDAARRWGTATVAVDWETVRATVSCYESGGPREGPESHRS